MQMYVRMYVKAGNLRKEYISEGIHKRYIYITRSGHIYDLSLRWVGGVYIRKERRSSSKQKEKRTDDLKRSRRRNPETLQLRRRRTFTSIGATYVCKYIRTLCFLKREREDYVVFLSAL